MKDSINRRCTQIFADKIKKEITKKGYGLICFLRSLKICVYLQRASTVSLSLCAFCAFAGNSFAQDIVLTQKQIDFLPEQIALQEKLKSGNTEQKRDALSQIRNLKSAEASRIAIPALRDKSEIVRATAAQSVVFLPSDEAAQVLLPLLKDKSILVRKEAAYALGKTRSPLALSPLVSVLRQTLPRKKEQRETELEFRSATVIALGEIGDVSAVDSLLEILQRNAKVEEEFLRRSATRSIGQIAEATLQKELSSQTDIKDFLVFAKENRKLLSEKFPSLRAAVSVLIQALQSSKEADDVKRESAFALGAIGDVSAILVLQSKLNAEDYYLAEICKEALKKIFTR